MTSTLWTKVDGFRHENPMLSSVLIFCVGLSIGFLLHLVWPPLAQSYALALVVLFFAYELRKRVLTDRSSLVWMPSLVTLGPILLLRIRDGHRIVILCTWLLASVALLKLRRRARRERG